MKQTLINGESIEIEFIDREAIGRKIAERWRVTFSDLHGDQVVSYVFRAVFPKNRAVKDGPERVLAGMRFIAEIWTGDPQREKAIQDLFGYLRSVRLASQRQLR